MGKRHLTRDEINALAKGRSEGLDTSARAMQLVSLVVLHEAFDFDAQLLNDFVDRFQEALEYYNESNDYQKMLKEWNDYFRDYAGIDLLYKGVKRT